MARRPGLPAPASWSGAVLTRRQASTNTAVPPVPARRRKEADPVPRVMAGSLTRARSATVDGDDLTGLVCWSRGFLR
jgi:hypothetical protein